MNREHYNQLFDYYKKLLTDKENNIFIEYYQEDLSMQEIADNLSISKAAVGKTIKTVEKKLKKYEDILKLRSNNQKINKLLEDKIDESLLKEINKYI